MLSAEFQKAHLFKVYFHADFLFKTKSQTKDTSELK